MLLRDANYRTPSPLQYPESPLVALDENCPLLSPIVDLAAPLAKAGGDDYLYSLPPLISTNSSGGDSLTTLPSLSCCKGETFETRLSAASTTIVLPTVDCVDKPEQNDTIGDISTQIFEIETNLDFFQICLYCSKNESFHICLSRSTEKI